MKAIAECRLYTFVDTAYLRGRSAAEVAQQLCEGGSDIIQLRAKSESRDQVRVLAESILPVTRAAAVPLVINDYSDIAREVGAEFVHLGQEDFFDVGFIHRDEHPQLRPPLQLGLSSHAPDQAQRAIAAGADYIAVGPVFATPTKPGRPGVTLDYVRWAAANVQCPWFAIGGVSEHNIDDLIAAGARRVCIVSAILKAASIVNACQHFRRRLDDTD